MSQVSVSCNLVDSYIKDVRELKEVETTIKNIGNGFVSTLVVHTGFNLGGLEFRESNRCW